jgi:hypothetical protein
MLFLNVVGLSRGSRAPLFGRNFGGSSRAIYPAYADRYWFPANVGVRNVNKPLWRT